MCLHVFTAASDRFFSAAGDPWPPPLGTWSYYHPCQALQPSTLSMQHRLAVRLYTAEALGKALCMCNFFKKDVKHVEKMQENTDLGTQRRKDKIKNGKSEWWKVGTPMAATRRSLSPSTKLWMSHFMQLHGAQTPLRTRPGSKQSLYKVLWVSDTVAEAPFLKIMAQDTGRWWKPFIFSPNKHYPPLDSENINMCFFRV